MRASTVGSRFLDRCGDSLGVEISFKDICILAAVLNSRCRSKFGPYVRAVLYVLPRSPCGEERERGRGISSSRTSEDTTQLRTPAPARGCAISIYLSIVAAEDFRPLTAHASQDFELGVSVEQREHPFHL